MGTDGVVAEATATSEQTGRALARALSGGDLSVPGHHVQRDDLSVELVGSGESYAAWAVRPPNQAPQDTVLFRFPRRPPQEQPAEMAAEFAALRQVPAHLGSRGIAMDDTTGNVLGRRYLVTTYVPGRVVDGALWTQDMLDAHTRHLADLHDATGRDHSADLEVDPALTRPPARDLAAELSADFDSWCAGAPQLAADSSATWLVPAVLEHLQRRRWSFQHCGPPVLVHGDAVATNVVFDDAGTARSIDWEWAHVGDVAQDLAYVGGQVHGGPWYVPMSSAQVEAQVWQYLRARRTVEPTAEAFEVLLARRQAWEVYERFMSSLHFERVHHASPANHRYGPWVKTQRATLAHLLADVSRTDR
ncbi:MAG: phosphotransferase [Quadrisphaera sp.]